VAELPVDRGWIAEQTEPATPEPGRGILTENFESGRDAFHVSSGECLKSHGVRLWATSIICAMALCTGVLPNGSPVTGSAAAEPVKFG